MPFNKLSRQNEGTPSPPENSKYQLELYDPSANDGDKTGICSNPSGKKHPSSIRKRRATTPSVQAFAVQCAKCCQWRLIPTQEKYEEIRETVREKPFYCETGREWRPEITCDDPPDVVQDESMIWAIDRANIPKPPSGWTRLLKFRNQGGARFADVHYTTPSGKQLRSMVEIQRFLEENPEDAEGSVSLSKFSFVSPKPLKGDYLRKRPADAAPTDEPIRVQPMASSSRKKRTKSKRRRNSNLIRKQEEANGE